ncbi:MAG: twin-arginine translocase subunit TatC [Chitinophagales bacterium]
MALDQIDVDKVNVREDGSIEDTEMSFIDHLESLRWHVVRAVLSILIFTIATFLFKGFVFDTLIFGPTKLDFPTYRGLCALSEALSLGNMLCIEKLNLRFINIEMAGQFLVHLKVSFVFGFVMGFPYTLWELWKFIRPGLYQKEIRYTRGIVFFSSLLFFLGVSFGYFILTPFAINFFSNYQVSELVSNDFTLTNYVSFLTMFVLASGLIFELPMLVYFLSKIGLLTPGMMREYRRHAVVAILAVSAVITPADVGTMLLVFVPVYFLYEISIFISASVAAKIEEELNS